MDSLTHIALGASIGMAAMGRRTAAWKAALWGAVASTLPDLDVFIRHGDPILDMVLHRGHSHALLWLALLAPCLAGAVAWLHGERALWRRWWLALGLSLWSHPLLDTVTVYGTQLALPFSHHPFSIGSLFIIDPLFTLPVLAGALWMLHTRGHGRGPAVNAAGLLLGAAYVAWSLAAQQYVERIARASLAAQGIVAEHLLVTPTAFNTVLWRVVATSGGQYEEGFYSLLDATPQIRFDRFDRGAPLAAELHGLDGVQRLMAFSHGLYALREEHGEQGSRLLVSDLRMGQEPAYTFTFAVAERRAAGAPAQPLVPAVQQAGVIDIPRALAWLWRRALGEPLPAPR